MKRISWLVPSLALLAGSSWGQNQFVNGNRVADNEVLVKFRNAPAANFATLRQLTQANLLEPVGRAGLYRLRSAAFSASNILTTLQNSPDVEYAEPNYIVTAVAVPNDPLFSQLWGLQNDTTPGADISAVPAWDITTGTQDNVVAVIDTGVDYNHIDLAGNIWSAPADFTVTIGGQDITCPMGSHGFNAILRTCDPMDDFAPVYHGTHVSGTIGAIGNNGVGVAGVNWTASIMGIKFLNAAGSGTNADAINAIDFAIQAKQAFADSGGANVRVLSNSWGCLGAGCFSRTLLDEINLAGASDMLFVAAAGNNSSNNDLSPFFPADYDTLALNVLAVAATDINDNLAFFSNYGPSTVHLGAPGVNVLSTMKGNGYQSLSGTSMATPHVSGAAALVLSACPMDTPTLVDTLLSTVDVTPALTGLTITGGRLNVFAALNACSGGGTSSVSSLPGRH
jgi:subtilisin family serine protease